MESQQPDALPEEGPKGVALCAAGQGVRWTTTWLAWLAFGFLVGWHWLVIFLLVAQTRADRKAALLHLTSYLLALFLTAGGGAYVRSGNAVSCGNVVGDMGRDCLWDLQGTAYQVVYTLHYIGLAWLALSWVYDGVQLPGWLMQSQKGELLRVCYSSHHPLAARWYSIVLCVGLLLLTLTWTVFVDWTTNGGLAVLAAALIVDIVAVGLLSCGCFHFARKRKHPCVGSSDVSPSSVSTSTP